MGTETNILKLKKPAEIDFYSVKDFNDNSEKIEMFVASDKARAVTLRVEADLNTAVAVSHSSGNYSGTATTHTDAESGGTGLGGAYAEFSLPRGGNAIIMCTSKGNPSTQTVDLVDGAVERIINHRMTVYMSVMAKVPDKYFSTPQQVDGGTIYYHENILLNNSDGNPGLLTRVSFETLQSGYVADLDHKNELWHAVRTGMITSANYQTITGETYPAVPPIRIEQ